MTERTPAEWRDRLLQKLERRQGEHARLRRYYDGDHTLPTAPDTASVPYLRLAELGVTNMCGLIVDTVVERLVPKGVRLTATGDGDLDVWRDVWQANDLDGEMPVGFEESLKVGRCPMLIWPDETMPAGVRWTIEDPDETIVAYKPGDRRVRVAALKAFKDEDGTRYATVWVPDRVASWVKSPHDNEWRTDPDPAASGENPLAVVPVLELPSKMNVKGVPTPELSTSVLRLQDRINKTMFDAVVGTEDMAFPQRATIGIEIENDADGNPINPLRSGPSKVWVLDAVEGQESTAKIIQLEAFDPARLIAMAEATIKQLAAVSKTSVFYVLAGLTNVGADTIRLAEAAHVGKIASHKVRMGQVIEEGFKLALRAIGADVAADIELDWAPSETRSPAELADAAIKMSQAGYPFAAIARYMGATQPEVDRIERERMAATAAATSQPPAPPVATA